MSPSLYLAGILALGVAAQWIAWRMRIPAIVMLLLFGFAVGQFAPPDQFIPSELLFPVVSLAVGIILFEGGLSLRFAEIQDLGGVVARLVSVGLIATWLLVAAAAYLLLEFSLPMAMLTGALLTVSGPTVVLPLLRHVRPNRRIGSVTKWEGIVNDPIGAVLAALVFETIVHESEPLTATSLEGLGLTVFWGVVLGVGAALLMIWVLKRYLIPDYLQNAAILAVVVLIFAISNYLQHESGLLTVTILGLVLTNQQSVTVKHVIEFKENLRVLLISTLFIVLASRLKIDMDVIRSVGWREISFLGTLLLVRIFVVFMSTYGADLKLNERMFLAWIHPRGIVAAAVASFFALRIGEMHGADSQMAAEANRLVLITFFVIVGTVTIYGLSLGAVARRLGLASSNPQGVLFVGATQAVREIAQAVKQEGFATLLVDTNHANVSAARLAGLPTCFANVGSGYVHEEVDLGDIGRLLAMTPNNEVNLLAVMEFAEEFGRAEVYQLAPPAASSARQQALPSHRRGRLLFEESATFENLEERFAEGASVKCTSISADFPFADFLARHGSSALVLFIVDENGRLKVSSTEDALIPSAGQRVIALVDAADE